jgi:N-carbamoylputrescine amidase
LWNGPTDLSTGDPQWIELSDSVTAVHPDILVTNELPFGPWLACRPVFSKDEAHLSVRAHEKALEGLIESRSSRRYFLAAGVER